MNNQSETSKRNISATFEHSCAKIGRFEDDKNESDDDDYLITIKEEESYEDSIITESTPMSTFTIPENNVEIEQYSENSDTTATLNITTTKTWLRQELKNPIEYFNSVFDGCFLDKIVKIMNQEARMALMSDFRYDIHDLRDVTVSRFNIFIGLWLHTGTAKMNRLPEYWKRHRLIKSCFPDYMKLERFTSLQKIFESSTLEPNHYIAIDNFNNFMDKYYIPGKNLQLNVFGLDMFHNSIISETDAIKTGALVSKIFVLFDQDGPILKITTDDKVCSSSTLDKEKLFLTLLEGKLDCGYSLYVTPKITIPVSMAILLLKRKTYCNGILEPQLNEQCLNEDDSVYLENVYTGPYSVDTNGETTYYISTEFKSTPESEPAQTPEAIGNYLDNSKLNGLQDICAYYPFEDTDISKGSTLFSFILMASIKNASIASGIDFNDCRLKIIEQLLPENKQLKENKKHRLKRIPSQSDRRDCYNCATAKNLCRITVYWCEDCDNSPPFCVECFFDVHLQD